jgi:hypothetical protein
MGIGRGRDEMGRHPARVGDRGVFEAGRAAIDRGFPGLLAPAWRLGQTPVDHDGGEIKPEQPVVLREHQRVQGGRQAGGGWCGRSSQGKRSAHSPSRGPDRDHVLEDAAIRDAAAVAAERVARMNGWTVRRLDAELGPDGLQQ